LKWTEADHHHMSRALQLARRGIYTTPPNPNVGCILARDNTIIAEGWHHHAGGPHAEIEALNQAGEKAKDADCYVTLEPCAHSGRTPPCTEALITAGIRRVVIAAADPNPLVAGRGIQQLETAGIRAETGLLQAQAQAINPGFEMRMRKGRPYVRCKLAMSVDGRTAMANGESKWISSEASRRDGQRLRARSSAIMTGVNTVLADDPSLTVRGVDTHGRQPVRVIIDRELRTPATARMLDLEGETIIFAISGDNDQKNKLEAAGAQVVTLHDSGDQDFLNSVLHYLAEEREVNEVLLESGATLAGKMLEAGVLDEIIIYMAPVLLGQKARPLFNLDGITTMSDRLVLDYTDMRMLGPDVRITLKPVISDW
jgi:diaminohydroxyphosphoribosylaminopyrimidine deaminase / 5-amino-6-(5-phosphoribosylamino)uracil reductase